MITYRRLVLLSRAVKRSIESADCMRIDRDSMIIHCRPTYKQLVTYKTTTSSHSDRSAGFLYITRAELNWVHDMTPYVIRSPLLLTCPCVQT